MAKSKRTSSPSRNEAQRPHCSVDSGTGSGFRHSCDQGLEYLRENLTREIADGTDEGNKGLSEMLNAIERLSLSDAQHAVDQADAAAD